MNRPGSFARRSFACAIATLSLVSALSGCAALHPVRGVPAVYLPDDYLGEERSGRETINLSLLVRNRPEQHHIEAGDLLAVFIPGILGSVNHTDDASGENPPISNPLGENLLPTIGYPIIVQDDHTISLPYLPTINVYGLTTEQAAERIRQTALSLGILRSDMGKDRVLVSLQQPRQYRILVVRQEATADNSGSSQPGSLNVGTSKRGNAQLVSLPAYENDVLHALMGNRNAANSGLPGLDAKNFIYVIRGRRGQAAGYPGTGAAHGQIQSPYTVGAAPANAPAFGSHPSYPQQQWNGGMPGANGMPGSQYFDPYANPTGAPAVQYPAGSYYPQPQSAPIGMPYGQPQGMIIRGQSDVLPVGFWSPASHTRQLEQLDPSSNLGHSFHFAAQTTPPVWNGNTPINVPAPAPLSGRGTSVGTPNQMAPSTPSVSPLHPSLNNQSGGHSFTTQSPSGNPPLRTEVPDVPLLHPSLAPQRANIPAQTAPVPQPDPSTANPQRQAEPTPAMGNGGMPLAPSYSGNMQYGGGPQPSSGYVDPAIQQMAAMQGTPFDRQWAATLGGWSPTVESPDVIKIPIRLAPGQVPYLTEEDITLYDGDIVFIESRDSEVFYTGGLLGGGQYTLPRDNDLRVTQAVSIASARSGSSGSSRAIGGVSALNHDVSISASRVVIVRTLPCGQRVQIEVDLYKAFRFEDEDILILPGDMILLQYKCHEAVGAFFERYLLEGALLGIAAGSLNGGGNSGN